MDNKIKILDEKMKEINERLFINNCSKYIALKFIDDDGEEWYIGKYFFDGNTFEKISKGYAPSLYNKLEKYFDNFKELCKKLFKGDDEMGKQKIIEVTNLDELEELINKASELSLKARNTMYTLDEMIEEIKCWKMSCCVKKEDKIDILNNYVKSLDERLVVIDDLDGDIDLCFEFQDNKYVLAYFDCDGKFNKTERKYSPKKQFEELEKYAYAFKGKYDELFN